MAERHAIRRICFILLREFILTHTLHRRTVCCFCTLNVSCFRKSFVIHAHRARPRLPSCKRLRSKECPRRRIKWRYATAGQQQTAKQAISNERNQMAFCHYPNNKRPRSKQCPMCRVEWCSATTEQQEIAEQNGVLPHPNNKRFE